MRRGLVLSFFIAILFSSCGYKPSAKYARVVLGETISTNVVISLQDPENTVMIKDSLDRAVLEVFNASLRDKRDAQTHLKISLQSVTYRPIQYNRDGYVVAYRTFIKLLIVREHKEVKKEYIGEGTYDFSIVANAVVTDQERFDSIEHSAVKAIRSFIAQVSSEGARRKKEEKE
jgi:hypothetical protein